MIQARAAVLVWLTFTAAVSAQPAGELWSRRVQPLLDLQCVKCHGPLEQKGGLELDTPEAVLKGGDDGAVVVAGKPEKSPLFTNLAAGADSHMPPKKQLTDAEQAVIKEWIVSMATDTTPKLVKTEKQFSTIPEAVNHFLAAGWSKAGVTPATPTSDAVWVRRIHLDLVGRIPTGAESTAFVKSTEPQKRERLVDALLASNEHAVRMRELWDVLLMGRGKRGNSEDRRKQNGWWGFLEQAFEKNQPWNQTVRAILAGRPAKPEEKGASWFIYERRNDHQKIAEAVAPIIYGAKVDCAQCHDHPLAREIKQGHYWGLVTAFNRSKNVEGSTEVAEAAVGGYMNFTNLKKESQPAIIALLTGHTVNETWPASDAKQEDTDENYVDAKAKVKVPKTSRREALADAATQANPLLARAFVNRMWAAFLGRGIVHPADEMISRNVPSHPELLDWLSKDFENSNYDVRRFLRGLVLSQAYTLDQAPGSPETFASAMERPLSAEQLARSWRTAVQLPPTDDTLQPLRKATVAAMPDVMPAEYNATFQQAQFLTNEALIADLLKPAPGKFTERLAAEPNLTKRVELAFQAVYGRSPDAEEAAQSAAFLAGQPEAAAQKTRDMLWAMLTSAEFMSMP